jgi:alpha-1,2-mannosyltransferase
VWALAALNLVRGARFALAAGDRGLGDFGVYLAATRWMRAGKPLYEYATDLGLGFTYPPFAALVLAPWGMLPNRTAEVLWTLLTLAATVVIGLVIGHRIRPEWSPVVRWGAAGLAVAILTQTVLVQANLATGQISLLLVAMSLVDTGRVFRSRRWGALSGLASAIKLTPSVFLVFHLIVDRKRAAWSIGTAVAATLLGAALLPRESWTYWTSALWQTGRVGQTDVAGNVTWVGVVARAGLDSPGGRLLGLLLGAATAVVALWNARRHWHASPVTAAAIVGCASVVAAPVSWPHHAVWLAVWGACLLLSTSRLLQVVGLVSGLLWLVWVPVAEWFAGQGWTSVLSAVPVLLMTAAATIRVGTAEGRAAEVPVRDF